MQLRVFTEPQQGASYTQLVDVARAAEECGYDAFFRSDHYWRMGPATGLPAYTDAWVTLAGLARDTTGIRLGTLVSPVTFRAVGTFPLIVSQVDNMSGGRVEVGVGAGWFEEEHRAYGLDFPSATKRFDLLEDQLSILHGVWSAPPGTVFEHRGLTCSVQLDPGPLRPAQQPHPPIILGGAGGPRGARLAARFANEFNAPFVPIDQMKKAHRSVRAACEAAGRSSEEIVWSTAQVLCCGQDQKELARRAAAIGREIDELQANDLAGTPAEVLDKMGAFAQAGAQRLYLQVLDLSDLDHLRLVAEEVMPLLP